MKRPTIECDVALGRYHAPTDLGIDADAKKRISSLPGVVLIHDVWGLSDHSRALAIDLASEGFGVLEIDLYREMAVVSIDTPGAFIQRLSDPEILADIDVGADWLVEEIGPRTKLAVVGVCMGGTYALLTACHSDRFSAAAPFYGILAYDRGLLANPDGRDRGRKPISPLEAAAGLRMPLLASFGAEDEFVPVADVRELEAGLKQSGLPVRVDVHAGAGHAFLNRTREGAYHPGASKAAWADLIPFLHSELDG